MSGARPASALEGLAVNGPAGVFVLDRMAPNR